MQQHVHQLLDLKLLSPWMLARQNSHRLKHLKMMKLVDQKLVIIMRSDLMLGKTMTQEKAALSKGSHGQPDQ